MQYEFCNVFGEIGKKDSERENTFNHAYFELQIEHECLGFLHSMRLKFRGLLGLSVVARDYTNFPYVAMKKTMAVAM